MIQFVSGEYPPDVGGVGDYTAALRSALEARGWASEVVTRRQVRRWNAGALVWFARHAPRQGILHIQFQSGAFDLLGDICLLPAMLRLARPHLRSVTTFHDTRVPYLFPRAGLLRPAAVRLLARASHAVIAADERDLGRLGGPSPRHYRVPIGSNVTCAPPPGYSRDGFRSSLGLGRDDLVVVFFGMLNASKGLDLLLGTVDRLAHQRRVRLLLLGGDVGASDPTDRQTAARVGSRIERLGRNVIRTGWLEPPQLSAYLLAGDVALLPYADGASARRGSLLACAAHGLPIVSTRPAGVEVAPFVEAVAPEVDALENAVLHVAAQAGRRREVSRALAEAVGWPRIAARHVEIYERLLYSPGV